jgi:hypothetical protein
MKKQGLATSQSDADKVDGAAQAAFGMARPGQAWLGEARRGMVRRGLAW